jgi:hypothetical protein
MWRLWTGRRNFLNMLGWRLMVIDVHPHPFLLLIQICVSEALLILLMTILSGHPY